MSRTAIQFWAMETMPLHRHGEIRLIGSDLDPLDDVLDLIRGLRSVAVAEARLRSAHPSLTAAKLRQDAKRVAVFADAGVALVEEGMGARIESAFISLYYGLLNVSKVLIVHAGLGDQLDRHRMHGASWVGSKKRSQSLMTDSVELKENGTIPLLYRAVTGGALWPKSAQKTKQQRWITTHARTLIMSDVYSRISSIGYEYSLATSRQPKLAPISVLAQMRPMDSEWQGRVVIDFSHLVASKTWDRRAFRILAGFTQDSSSPPRFNTRWFRAPDKPALLQKLRTGVRSFLIWTGPFESALNEETQLVARGLLTLTPECRSNLMWPEEFPLLLATYHLSNVARYDPERFSRIMSSASSPLVSTLRRQGVYRFLLLAWAHLQGQTIMLTN